MLCTLGIFCLLAEIACLAQSPQDLTFSLGTDIILGKQFSVLLLLGVCKAKGVSVSYVQTHRDYTGGLLDAVAGEGGRVDFGHRPWAP